MTPRNLWRYGVVAIVVVMVAAIFAFPTLAQQKMGNRKSLSIEGTYIFVNRDLTPGSTTQSTNVEGMMTFTKKYRNFNISWEEPGGKHRSLAVVAEYKLTPDSYQQTPVYWLSYDESQSVAANYTVPADFAKPSPVTFKSGKVSFDVNGEGVSLTFEGNTFTAVMPGQFTDHWKRVD